jgi:hypothetical protein
VHPRGELAVSVDWTFAHVPPGSQQLTPGSLGKPLAARRRDVQHVRKRRLAERERIGFGAGFEECDLQGPFTDPVMLAHELV